jgi:hypothetical protein
LIDINKIDIDYKEIIYEKLHIYNDQVDKLQNELNENIYDNYNEKILELKQNIQAILNTKYEIIL